MKQLVGCIFISVFIAFLLIIPVLAQNKTGMTPEFYSSQQPSNDNALKHPPSKNSYSSSFKHIINIKIITVFLSHIEKHTSIQPVASAIKSTKKNTPIHTNTFIFSDTTIETDDPGKFNDYVISGTVVKTDNTTTADNSDSKTAKVPKIMTC